MTLFNIFYKFFRRIGNVILHKVEKVYCHIKLKGNRVLYADFNSTGIPFVMVARGGKMQIGAHFSMNNGIKGNPIGCYDPCTFFVDRNAALIIGENVGISQSALICHKSITIGNNVKIGGGVKIYDTDFHALNPELRAGKEDVKNRNEAPVILKDNAFIGAFSIILKGVTVGENSIVGAGSVVTKSIPDNQIWAGNPAKFIKDI